MKISDRLAVIETKLKYMEKLMYALFLVIVASTGIQII